MIGFAVTLLTAVAVFAQTDNSALDLRTAVQKAVENNHVIRQAKAKVEQDRYEISTTRSLIYPKLDIVATASQLKKDVGSGVSSPFGGSAYNQYGANLNLVQPLLAFGTFAAISERQYTQRIDELNLEIEIRTLSMTVIQTFYKVLLNQRLLEVYQRMAAVFGETLATAQQRSRTGRSQLLDVLQVKTQIALLKPKIEDARDQMESAGAELATLLSEENKRELKLKGAFKALLYKDVQPHINLKDARLPELEKVRLQREQLGQHREVVLGKHLPNLVLNGQYGAVSFTKGDLFSDYSKQWSLTLQLTIPLFSGFQSIHERRSLTEQDRQLDAQGRGLENALALAQVQSLKAFQSSSASLESAEEAAQLADQSMSEAKRNYRLSTIDFLQFLTVEKSALEANSQLDLIKFNNIVALSKYFAATGQPLSGMIDLLEGKRK